MQPGSLNVRLDHLSWIEIGEEPNTMEEGFPDVQLFTVCLEHNHFVDIIHFFTTRMAPKGYTS